MESGAEICRLGAMQTFGVLILLYAAVIGGDGQGGGLRLFTLIDEITFPCHSTVFWEGYKILPRSTVATRQLSEKIERSRGKSLQ